MHRIPIGEAWPFFCLYPLSEVLLWAGDAWEADITKMYIYLLLFNFFNTFVFNVKYWENIWGGGEFFYIIFVKRNQK